MYVKRDLYIVFRQLRVTRAGESKETYLYVKIDLYMCLLTASHSGESQKRLVKRDLYKCQKRHKCMSNETYT